MPAIPDLWRPESVYLNTASYGLPPAPAWEALQAALGDWHGGRTSWEPWLEPLEAARREFATMVGARPQDVAVGASVSGLVGLIAASLPRGTRVVAPDIEFTSLVFPFLVQDGFDVSFVPLARLAEAIDAATDVVVLSAVQSASGEVAPLEAVAAAARHHGALTVVDATQACGWLPLDASRVDVLTCAAFELLMSPHGTAFMSLPRELLERVTPLPAGWFAGEDIMGSFYGPPLRLA